MKYFLIILLFFPFFSKAQNTEINPNGYNIFYYGNKIVSSEGMMVDGKPEGLWITNYPSGKIKSKGIRSKFQLDSIWLFFDENGFKEKEISYLYGKKNGYYLTYSTSNTDTSVQGALLSKELYVDDIKQGLSYYYYNTGKIHKIIPFKDGKKDGIAKEFSKDSLIITLTEYYKDYYIDREKLNRKDKKGLKQGVWKDFFVNDRVHIESNFWNDTLMGYFREYDIKGNVIKEIKYYKGKEVKDTISEGKIVQKNIYWDNGKIKYSGAFRDSIKVGIHREYSEKEEVIKAYEYNDFGIKTGEGITDVNGSKQGKWNLLFEDGSIQASGEYKDNKKTGKWTYFFNGGSVEQTGVYVKGKPDGVWKWYYKNGNIWREENLSDGKEEGLFVEFDETGIEITKGEYLDGEKEGFWFAKFGDYREEGNYKAGSQIGLWKWFYQDGTLQFEGKFIDGEPEGEHKYFHENGKIKLAGKYLMGRKEGNWRRFDDMGNIEIVFTYKDGKEFRIDGMKCKWPEENGK